MNIHWFEDFQFNNRCITLTTSLKFLNYPLVLDNNPLNISILGAGKFGRALADIAAHNGHHVILWARNPSKYRALCSYDITDNLQSALNAANILIIAIPSSGFHKVMEQTTPYISANCLCISATKGLDPNTYSRMSEVLSEFVNLKRIGVISGPNLATEVLDKQITGTVIASYNDKLNQTIQNIFSSNYLRVYSSRDVIGVEWAGLLKNIYAIIFGMVDQFNLGDNTKGMLYALSLVEMARFGLAHGAQVNTFLGLSGAGDLLTTCNSKLSRNFQVGQHIASKQTLEQAIEQVGETAEGINTVRVIHQQSIEKSIDMPLVHELYGVLFERVTPEVAIERLMAQMPSPDAKL